MWSPAIPVGDPCDLGRERPPLLEKPAWPIDDVPVDLVRSHAADVDVGVDRPAILTRPRVLSVDERKVRPARIGDEPDFTIRSLSPGASHFEPFVVPGCRQ